MEENKFTRKSTQDNFVSEKIDIFTNNLLGDYDNNGNYEIAPQIVNELLELEKYRKSSYGNSMFCVGNLLGYGEIVFEVYFNKDVDGSNAKAYLYVLEDVDKVNGYLQNTIKTLIAEFSSDVGNFIEDSYSKFNIKDSGNDDDDEGKERKDLEDLELDDSYILAKKAYMLLLEKLQEEKMLDAYGKLFTEKLSLISKLDSEFAKAVLERFNSQYALIENVFLKDKNYKALNELMDACIEYVSGTQEQFIDQEQEFNDKLAPALQSFTDNINDLAEKTEKKALNMLDREDREKLEEMIESQEHEDENEALSDNDIGGDGAVELIPTMETIQRMNDEPTSEILDNPVLYEGSEEKSEELGDQSEQENELEQVSYESQIAQEAQSIEDIVRNNKIEEPVVADSIQTTNTIDSSLEQPQESAEIADAYNEDRPSVIDTSRTSGLEDEEIITTESPKTEAKTIPEPNPEQESKDIEEIIESAKKEENKIPDSLMDYLNKRNQKATEVVSEEPKVDQPKVETSRYEEPKPQEPKTDVSKPDISTQEPIVIEIPKVETATPNATVTSEQKTDNDMLYRVEANLKNGQEDELISSIVNNKTVETSKENRFENCWTSLHQTNDTSENNDKIPDKIVNGNEESSQTSSTVVDSKPDNSSGELYKNNDDGAPFSSLDGQSSQNNFGIWKDPELNK